MQTEKKILTFWIENRTLDEVAKSNSSKTQKSIKLDYDIKKEEDEINLRRVETLVREGWGISKVSPFHNGAEIELLRFPTAIMTT